MPVGAIQRESRGEHPRSRAQDAGRRREAERLSRDFSSDLLSGAMSGVIAAAASSSSSSSAAASRSGKVPPRSSSDDFERIAGEMEPPDLNSPKK